MMANEIRLKKFKMKASKNRKEKQNRGKEKPKRNQTEHFNCMLNQFNLAQSKRKKKVEQRLKSYIEAREKQNK